MVPGTFTVVQKFGGSSVADATKMAACAKHVLKTKSQLGPKGEKTRVVVVVSAMGDTTDDLIALSKTVTAGSDSVNTDTREMDQLLATGEQAASALVALTLQRMGHKARSLTGWQAGIFCDERFGRASITKIDPNALEELLSQDIIPVIAGFQGLAPDGSVATLGRGGSDTTAVAIAGALGATCEILKDVHGVYTADPRLVPGARRLDTVTYDEMLEAAALGSQVIHPRAVELAKKLKVPVRVLHSHEPEKGSTVIVAEDPSAAGRAVTSVVLKKAVGRISIRGLNNRAGVQSEVFSPIAAAGVPVDDIIQEDDGPGTINLTFTLDQGDAPKAAGIVRAIAGTIGAQAVRIDGALSTVSAVGAGMRNRPGVAAALFEALKREEVVVENITTSEIRISVVVAEADGPRTARCIHQAFDLANEIASSVGVGGGGSVGGTNVGISIEPLREVKAGPTPSGV